MLVIIVCDQANIWFFSENSTDKNKAIAKEQILLKKKVFRNLKQKQKLRSTIATKTTGVF